MSPEVIKNLYQVRTFKVKRNKLFNLWLTWTLQEPYHIQMKWSEFETAAKNGTLTCLGKPVILID